MRQHLIWVLAASCATACGESSSSEGEPQGSGAASSGSGAGGSTSACFEGLSAIALDPDSPNVTLDGSSAAPIAFAAKGIFADGHDEALAAAKLAWTASRDDDTPPGEIDAGVLSPYPLAGGVVTVTASDGCGVSGSTDVTFYLDAVVGEPSDPDAWQEPPETGGDSPLLVYPSDQTRFPRNLYRTLFQWRTQGLEEFRLVFEGASSKVTVYSDGIHGLCADATPAAGCWEVDETTWSFIAASNAGASASWVVDALDTSSSPPTVWRSDAVTLGFSKEDVEGAIFYWSTTSAGIRRGRISQPEPEDYIVAGTSYDSDEVKCVACHTFSRDGKYMAAPVKSAETDSLWIAEVTADAPPTPLVTSVESTGGHGFATISPDDEHVVVSFKQDSMWMVSRATGAYEASLATEAFDGGTHPDWSPLGDELVFASGKGDAPGGSALVLIPWDGSAWGTPSELHAPAAGLSNLFPMFAPDGQWIAYAQGNGGHGDPTAQLALVHRSGGDAIELERANRVTNNELTDGQYQNSQPTWAPPGDCDWVAFNSQRAYGVVLPQGTQQIWVAAVDLALADGGEDPSLPAFRVPFQGLDENNHRAFWTLDVGMGSGGGGQGGAGGGGCTDVLTLNEACDPLNDCCESGSYCDTVDNGETYVCVADIQ